MKENTYIDDPLYITYMFNASDPYYLTIPKELYDEYELFISFPTSNPSDIKIKELNDILIRTNNKAIHLICNLKRVEIDEFGTYNDNKVNLYKLLQRRLYHILANTYEYLKRKNIRVKLPVNLIKQNDNDSKLVNWLEIDDAVLIRGIDYYKIRKAYNELIFSGTMAMPFITEKENNNIKVRKRVKNEKGYTKFSLILMIVISIIISLTLANLLIIK